MTGRTLAIGDIHGCRVALETLLTAVDPQPGDTIITLGDYVDRGPDSKGVVDLLIELSRRVRLVPLRGNHEDMMLGVLRAAEPYEDWLRHGGIDTLDSYGFTGNLNVIPPEHHAFYDSLLDYFEADNHFYTHAAYDPELPLEAQPVELLRWHSLRDGVPGPHVSGRVAIVGHTANRQGEIFDAGHLVCIDTYCYGGGWLTALDINSGQIWKASERGKLAAP